MADVQTTGPVVTEQTPTATTTETRIVSTEAKPAVVSTVADIEAAIAPYVQRIEALEKQLSQGDFAQRLQQLETAVEAVKEFMGQTKGQTFWQRLVRLEQIIVQHFGAHQLATALPAQAPAIAPPSPVAQPIEQAAQ